MNDRKLDELFRAAPREIDPPHDLWPAIARRIFDAGRPPWLTPAVLAAAGLLTFLAGFGAGTSWPRAGETHPSDRGDSPFLAAVRVQETGTAYVGAIMRLRHHPSAGASDSAAVTQGREVALTTLGAARRAVEGTQDAR